MMSLTRKLPLLLSSLGILLLCSSASSLEIQVINIPAVADTRQPTRLFCSYDTSPLGLYSVKWYVDDREFFRYVPSHQPSPFLVFPLHEFDIQEPELDQCDNHRCGVNLAMKSVNASGTYSCEVSTETPFRYIREARNVSVMTLPQEKPRIEGMRSTYDIGEDLNVKCTSAPSIPPATLTFFVNGMEVHHSYTSVWIYEKNNEFTTTVDLTMNILRKHFMGALLRVKCVGTLADVPATALVAEVTAMLPVPQTLHIQKLEWPSASVNKAQINATCPPPYLKVDQVIEVGQWNQLDCVYREHFDHVDGLTWSRNGQVFITYPQDFEGLRITKSSNGKHKYENHYRYYRSPDNKTVIKMQHLECNSDYCSTKVLMDSISASGTYSCKVTGRRDDYINSFSISSKTTVLGFTPKKLPVIDGLKESYGLMDILSVSCTVAKSTPKTIISMYVNNIKVKVTCIGLKAFLKLMLLKKYFDGPILRVRCVGVIANNDDAMLVTENTATLSYPQTVRKYYFTHDEDSKFEDDPRFALYLYYNEREKLWTEGGHPQPHTETSEMKEEFRNLMKRHPIFFDYVRIFLFFFLVLSPWLYPRFALYLYYNEREKLWTDGGHPQPHTETSEMKEDIFRDLRNFVKRHPIFCSVHVSLLIFVIIIEPWLLMLIYTQISRRYQIILKPRCPQQRLKTPARKVVVATTVLRDV